MKIFILNIIKVTFIPLFFLMATQISFAQSEVEKSAVNTNEKSNNNVITETKNNVSNQVAVQKTETEIPVVTDRVYTEEEIKAIRDKKFLPATPGVYKYEATVNNETREAVKSETIENEKIVQPK